MSAADPALPFTTGGFAASLKSVRVQYWVGVVEAACVDRNSALKRWQALAKATPEIGTTDYPFAILALARVDAPQARVEMRRVLPLLERQLTEFQPPHIGELFYSQGILQLESGHKEEAAQSFRDGAKAGPPGLIEYLNLDGLHTVR